MFPQSLPSIYVWLRSPLFVNLFRVCSSRDIQLSSYTPVARGQYRSSNLTESLFSIVFAIGSLESSLPVPFKRVLTKAAFQLKFPALFVIKVSRRVTKFNTFTIIEVQRIWYLSRKITTWLIGSFLYLKSSELISRSFWFKPTRFDSFPNSHHLSTGQCIFIERRSKMLSFYQYVFASGHDWLLPGKPFRIDTKD